MLIGSVTCGPLNPTVLSVNDLTIAEVHAGTQLLNFTITRSGNTTGASSVTWNTLNSSAVAPPDFVAVGPTTVNFAAGETTKTASVTVNGDNVVEVNEAFVVRLSNQSAQSSPTTRAWLASTTTTWPPSRSTT
jgi:hypothetical protein